ncbi:MAG TPA: galactokinase [Streptosporangiaceae bacterium]
MSELRDEFTRAYDQAPDGVWRGPGRVNLIGEHTDYNEGLVLPFALPWGVDAAVARTDDGVVEVRSGQRPGEPSRVAVADLRPGEPSGWAAYASGVVWALREAGHDAGGARVLIDADLPIGAGLSSSAALECAVAIALNDLYALGLDARELAVITQRAENAFVGAPTGGMDQNASLRARAGHALYLDMRTGGASNVPFDLEAAGMRILIMDTRVKHALVNSEYAQRRRECEEAARILGVPALRDVEDLDAALSRIDDPVLRRRVTHVVTEDHRVNATVGLLRAGAIREVGAMLNASHISLRDDFEVSSPELDAAVEAAFGAGARGARMTGGGFGGAAIALVDEAAEPAVRDAVTARFAAKGWQPPAFYAATAAAGAHRR